MNEVAALALLCAASALFYGTDRPRGVARWRFLSLAHCRLARVAAVALVVAAGLLWNASEPGPAAFFAVLVGLMALGSAITLLAPVWPRSTWVLVGVAVPVSLLIAYLQAPPWLAEAIRSASDGAIRTSPSLPSLRHARSWSA